MDIPPRISKRLQVWISAYGNNLTTRSELISLFSSKLGDSEANVDKILHEMHSMGLIEVIPESEDARIKRY